MNPINGNKIHCLVRLSNALVSARCNMSAPRMDSNNQRHEALKMVLDAFDRETERELRIAVKRHISADNISS